MRDGNKGTWSTETLKGDMGPDLGTANFKAQQLPLKPFCTHGEQGCKGCYNQLILLLPLCFPPPVCWCPFLSLPVYSHSGIMRCHKGGADMDTPLFLGYAGDRTTQNNINSYRRPLCVAWAQLPLRNTSVNRGPGHRTQAQG